MEYKYLSEKECNQKLAAYGEERFMQELLTYLFGSNDQSVMKDKLRIVTGQLPVHMTKNKLFEKIKEAFTLYKGGEKAALQDFVYMLRTSAMVYEPAKSVGEYPAFEEALSTLAGADYVNLSKEQWEELTEVLRDCTEAIHEITDFYYSLQKVVNSIYALCVALPYQENESKLMGASKSIWCCLGKREYMDEMLVPLEGKIEAAVEKTGHLSAVFYEIKESYKEELASWGLDEFFADFTLVLNLLSDSLFIDLDKKVQNEMAEDNDVMTCAEQFINELSVKLSEVSRPVKKAIMSQVLEKLPMLFRNTEEVQEYIRVNLFGCQDKAEKAIVMELLQDLIREEQEW